MPGLGSMFGKLFGGASRSEAPLRAYGKLPMFAEYRRLDIASGAAAAFSRWLDEGRLVWVQSASHAPDSDTRDSDLAVGFPDSRDVVLAALNDSRDSLGRVFPFAFMVTIPSDALGAEPLERFLRAQLVHAALRRQYAELHNLAQGGDFARHFAGRVINLGQDELDAFAQRIAQEARMLSAERWFAGTALAGIVRPEDWYTGLLQRSRRWSAAPAGHVALSFPLSSAASIAAQGALWLRWCSVLLKAHGRAPQVLVTAEPAARGSLVLLLRDLMPADYQLITDDEGKYEFVERLAVLPPPTDGSPTARVLAPSGLLMNWIEEHAPAG